MKSFTSILMLLLLAETAARGGEPCRVEVVETGSGWPVPLVILETTGHQRFVSDNAGVIAIDELDLMGREVFFHVSSPGYEVPADGFGIRGVRLVPKAGETLRVEATRTIIAKRLGRLTGSGLFANARKSNGGALGLAETGVVGCDSVQMATYRGKRFWLWGDTTLHHYPLGVFHSTAATTPVRSLEAFEPPIHIGYECFRDENDRPRAVAKMPGRGPTWLSAMVALPDADGEPRLVATYAKIEPPLETYECGLCTWDDEARRFERTRVVWEKTSNSPKPSLPEGHPSLWTDETGKKWVLFGNPLPRLRCPASYEAWADPATWERLEPQKTLKSADGKRDVVPHTGSIAWHPWRKKWVTVFMEKFGKPSAFGELWYAEADEPTGPWGPAVKVLSHANYTFYNPRIHEEWFDADSPVLCFEGTYTTMFADRPVATPRWDYNQVLYRLDLDDERLAGARGE